MNRRTFTVATGTLAVTSLTAGCLTAGTGLNGDSKPVFQAGPGGASSVDTDALEDRLASYSVGDISTTERDDVCWMREEEKLARDAYIVLFDEWELQIHDNIVDAEQSHMDAMVGLVELYDLVDPATGTVGTFTNDELQALYDELIEWGHQSTIDSLKVGCRIEETDIRDIQVRIDRTDEPAITLVYENLLKGSRNHLRAFYRTLTRRGGEYEPAIIEQSQFDDIVSSDFETGTV